MTYAEYWSLNYVERLNNWRLRRFACPCVHPYWTKGMHFPIFYPPPPGKPGG